MLGLGLDLILGLQLCVGEGGSDGEVGVVRAGLWSLLGVR